MGNIYLKIELVDLNNLIYRSLMILLTDFENMQNRTKISPIFHIMSIKCFRLSLSLSLSLHMFGISKSYLICKSRLNAVYISLLHKGYSCLEKSQYVYGDLGL